MQIADDYEALGTAGLVIVSSSGQILSETAHDHEMPAGEGGGAGAKGRGGKLLARGLVLRLRDA